MNVMTKRNREAIRLSSDHPQHEAGIRTMSADEQRYLEVARSLGYLKDRQRCSYNALALPA